ncbi:MAG: RagB/SusD family nutrient uptake outer membrane protein, partial [Chitinophagaceae bacterium]
IIAIVLMGAVSCKKQSFLDDKTTNLIDVDAVFSDSIRTMAFVTRMYEEIPFQFNLDRWEGGNTVQGTDDAEFTLANPARRPVALYLGAYGPDQFIHGDAWNIPWNNIRRVNLLIKNLPSTPLPESLKGRIKGEAKFMRAYFYTCLIVNFGGIPIVGDSLFTKDDNIDIPRSTFEQSVNYVLKDLDEAAALLPIPNVGYDPSLPPGQTGYEDRDYGRVTKGACLALKAKLLLYAASPLFNGGAIAGASEDQKKVAGYPVFDASRWQKAADAAKAVMQSGYYSLHDVPGKPGLGFYDVFLQRVNREYILFVNRPPNRDMENAYLPSTRGGGFRYKPTQNLVDCFPMKNGKSIQDPTSGYDPANPYYNRDPRFNYSIIFNGSRYQRANTGQDTVFTYSILTTPTNFKNPTADGYNPNDAPPSAPMTGYFLRKMCDSSIANNSSANTNRGWPLLRYAGIVLGYAEAINEAGQTALAYDAMKDIRKRAGIDAGGDGLYGMKAAMTVAEMRAVIQNERHIELAFEGDARWDDIRRWKIAEVVNNGKLRGILIERSPQTMKYTYKEVFGFVPHSFAPKQYLFPIPGLEIRRMPSMIQNPGW